MLITRLPTCWSTWWLHTGFPHPIDPGYACVSILTEARIWLALEKLGLAIESRAHPIFGGINAITLWTTHLHGQLAARLICIYALAKRI